MKIIADTNTFIAVALNEPEKGRIIQLTDGEHRIFDLTPYLNQGVFVRLQNRAVFQAVRVVAGSVE